MARQIPITGYPDRSLSRRLLSIAILLALVVLAYSNGMNGDFQFDDTSNILESTAIRQFDFSLHSLTRLVPDSPEPSQRRPVAVLSFAVNNRLTGLTTLSLHLWNLAIHLFNTLMVYLLSRAILMRALSRSVEDAHLSSLLAAGLWALNPVNTQAVTYLVQRMTSLMTAFFLAACYLYIRARSSGGRGSLLRHIPVVLLFLFALGTKESAVTLPVALLLLEISLFTPPSRFFRSLRSVVLTLAIAVAAAALAAFLFGSSVSLSQEVTEKGFNSIQRLMTQPRVLWWYVTVFLFPLPSRLNIDIDFPVSTGLLVPPVTVLAIIAWMAVLFWAMQRLNRERLGPIAVLWFLITSSVEASFLMLDMAYLHRLYLPMVLPSVWFANTIMDAIRSVRPRTSAKWLKTALGLLPLVFLLLLGIGTMARNSVLSSTTSLWEDTVAKSPGRARPHFNLGFVYQEQFRLDAAEKEYLQAIKIRPDYFRPYANLVPIYMSRGQYSQALPFLEKALEHGGQYADVQFIAGKVFETLGVRDRALQHFERSTTGLLPHHRDEAFWKISLIHRYSGDRVREIQALKELVNNFAGDNAYSRQAAERLASIYNPGAER